jgi:hypothetical protein
VRRSGFGAAIRIVLVVGTLLTAVNLGESILAGQADVGILVRVVANYLIP